MAATFKVTWIEDGSSSLMTADELHKEHGGESKPDEFISTLLATPVMQAALLMRLEKLDPVAVYELANRKLNAKQKEVDAARKVVDSAVLEILKEITEDEVALGEHKKLSDAATASEYTLVDYWLRKSKTNLAMLLKNHKNELPEHVYEELEAVDAERKERAAKRGN
ncbi:MULTISPECIES: hypothetical protein [Curtobacterium]|uniref:hypothetical protein n=1 Tax=Curtobacterium flaccumfaciens TaxID=2035 RepID=UPI003EE6F8E3